MTNIDDIKIRNELVPGDMGYVVYLHDLLYGISSTVQIPIVISLDHHELTAAASLYQKHGFKLTEEKESTSFGKPLREQRYDLFIDT